MSETPQENNLDSLIVKQPVVTGVNRSSGKKKKKKEEERKMKNNTISRTFAFVVVLVLLVPVLPVIAMDDVENGSLDNFIEIRSYQAGMFSDVPSTSWFSDTVAFTYSIGLFDGMGGGQFAPNESFTVAQSIKVAACLHSIYYNGHADFVQGSPWYQVYIDYLDENDVMVGEYHSNYDRAITRMEFAGMFASVFPDEALSEINNINDGDVPDLVITHPGTPLVYVLYRAGILTGSDDKLTFNPDSTIRRSEASAIAGRMANTELRQNLEKEPSMPGKIDVDHFFDMQLDYYVDMYSIENQDYFTGATYYIFSELIDYVFFFVTESDEIDGDIPDSEYFLHTLYLPVSEVFPDYEGKLLDDLTEILGDAYSIVPTSTFTDTLYADRHGVYVTAKYTYNFTTSEADGIELISKVGIERTQDA